MSTLVSIKVRPSSNPGTDQAMFATSSLQSAANRSPGFYLEHWQWQDASPGTVHESFACLDDLLELFRLQQSTVGCQETLVASGNEDRSSSRPGCIHQTLQSDETLLHHGR